MEKAVLRNNGRWTILNVWVIRILLFLNVCASLVFLAGTIEIAYILFMHRRLGFINSGVMDFFSRYVWTAHQVLSYFSAVIFIVWLYRAYSNLYRLKVNGLYYRFWLIVSWFIPVVNFFMPYRLVRNLFVRTIETIGIADSFEYGETVRRLRRWWGLWLYCIIGGNTALILMCLYPPAPPAGLYLAFVYLTVTFSTIPLCIVTMRLIRHYQSLENRLRGQDSDPLKRKDAVSESLIDHAL